jgi:hypothetical protein
VVVFHRWIEFFRNLFSDAANDWNWTALALEFLAPPQMRHV